MLIFVWSCVYSCLYMSGVLGRLAVKTCPTHNHGLVGAESAQKLMVVGEYVFGPH